MKIIKEHSADDVYTWRDRYHLPRSTRNRDRMEYTGQQHIAYCGYEDKDELIEKDFTEYDSRIDLPKGKTICGDCIYEIKEERDNNPSEKIFSGEMQDSRIVVQDEETN